jgi:hypothetical protein
MTKLEELKAVLAETAHVADEAAYDAWAAYNAADTRAAAEAAKAADTAYAAAWNAYHNELKKIQEEKQNDEESYCSIIPRGC